MGTPTIDRARLLADLDAVLALPSVGGSTAEVLVQEHLAAAWRDEGLDVDAWELDLPGLTADPDFPGMEVPRTRGLGVVARVARHRRWSNRPHQRAHRRRAAR